MTTRGFTPSHPYAELFPLHDEGKTFDDFWLDIQQNGLKEKIVKYQDKILDGRRRERACRRAGIEPKYVEFKGTDEQALIFSVSKNLHRRHLGEGERAIVAARIVTTRQGNPGIGKNHETSQNATFTGKPVSAKEAAEMTGSTEAKVDRAKKVISSENPVLEKAVIDGTLSVSDAASIADEPEKVQNQAVEDVKSGKASTAKKAVADKKKTADKPVPVDAFGTEIPKSLRSVFEDSWVQSSIDFIAVIEEKLRKERLADGMNKRAKHLKFMNAKDFIDGVGFAMNYLDRLLEHLKENRFAAVCPSCEGKKCHECKESGLVPRNVYAKLKGKKK